MLSAGWVTALGAWLRSSDLSLSLLAAKTLANMDRCDREQCEETIYTDSVYIYHPQYHSDRLDQVEC